MVLASLADVRSSFSKAALSYQDAASHQKNMASQVVEYYVNDVCKDVLESKQCTILDLGCGTGFVAEALQKHVAREQIIQLDISEAMLEENFLSKNHLHKLNICADMQVLPLKDECLSFCVSSYAMQWARDFDKTLREIFRVLKPGGACYFSLPAPQTFHELRTAWQQVDQEVHVHQFMNKNQIETAISASGFEQKLFSSRQDVLFYDSISEALRHIKKIGAHNLDQQRSKSLMGKKKFQDFCQAYEQVANSEGKFPLTYQSYFFVIHKPLAPLSL
jgi:malonyl-CoA O-methyltransferase